MEAISECCQSFRHGDCKQALTICPVENFMKKNMLFASTAVALALLPGISSAQDLRPFPSFQNPVLADSSRIPGGKRIRITYENLTPNQLLSASTFYSHITGLPPLFKEGSPASVGVMRTAEEGNVAVQADFVTIRIGGPYGSVALATGTTAGQSRTLELDVSEKYPLITGLFMIVQTNDGFSGVTNVDAYRMTAPVSMDLYAYDAGTERNNELAPYLIIQGGLERDPESEPVKRHPGIKGDADLLPKWKFDPSKPVARITFTPISSAAR
jgi:hypothetical protein